MVAVTGWRQVWLLLQLVALRLRLQLLQSAAELRLRRCVSTGFTAGDDCDTSTTGGYGFFFVLLLGLMAAERVATPVAATSGGSYSNGRLRTAAPMDTADADCSCCGWLVREAAGATS